MIGRKTGYEIWVVQGYIASNPKNPVWADISLTAINGWKEYEGHTNRIRYKGGQFWTNVMAFDDGEVAEGIFRELLWKPQAFALRLVRRLYVSVDQVVLRTDTSTDDRIAREYDFNAPGKKTRVADRLLEVIDV